MISRKHISLAALSGVLVVLAVATIWFGLGWRRATGTVIARPGIFEWFQKPAAVRWHGQRDQTYTTWIDRAGRAMIRAYDHEARSWEKPVVVFDAAKQFGDDAIDDHNGPSVVMLADGTLLVFTAIHDREDAVGVQRMISPEDASRWTEWSPIFSDTDAEYDYPQAKLLPDGTIRLFLRRGNWRQSEEIMVTSTDNGRTWSAPTTLVSFGANNGVYALISQSEKTIAMIWSPRPNGGRPQHLYAAKSFDGGVTWVGRDGASQAVPMTPENTAPVVPDDTSLYVWDVVTDAAGNIAATYFRADDEALSYGYASWRNGAWKIEKISDAALLYGATHFYAGGVVIDPNNATRVLISAQHAHKELEIWSRGEAGWQKVQSVTANSGRDNFRPQYIANDPDGHVVWSAGRYEGFINGNWTGYEHVGIYTNI